MKNLKILYRKQLMNKSELSAAKDHFDCVDLLSNVKQGDFVVSRYSSYPFPSDQEREILNIGATPINSYNQHLYIADLQNYVSDLKDLTPKTYYNLTDLPEDKQFILKGETNSKKSSWLTHMFAASKKDAIKIHSNLLNDSLISQQNIYIREFVPLVTYFTGIGGIPITKEFRFFVAFGKILAGGFYWSNYAEDMEKIPSEKEVPHEFLNKVIDIIGDKSNFYVIDVAQKQDGDWIVIELNDGCQSGLSCISPDILYGELYKRLSNDS